MAAVAAGNSGVHANDIAVDVDEGAARVSHIDGCICLEELFDSNDVEVRTSLSTIPAVTDSCSPRGLPTASTHFNFEGRSLLIKYDGLNTILFLIKDCLL